MDANVKLINKQYWYFHSLEECACCGKEISKSRIRKYGVKPKDSSKRYEYKLTLCCHCMVGDF